MPTIALVDDDRNILTSVSMTLESEGYRVQTYNDGNSALDGLTQNPPDLAILAQYEHRKAQCTRRVIRETPTFAEIQYSCPGGGFGRTTVGLLTPRSLRVETQGISQNAPFHYVLQARRVGGC